MVLRGLAQWTRDFVEARLATVISALHELAQRRVSFRPAVFALVAWVAACDPPRAVNAGTLPAPSADASPGTANLPSATAPSSTASAPLASATATASAGPSSASSAALPPLETVEGRGYCQRDTDCVLSTYQEGCCTQGCFPYATNRRDLAARRAKEDCTQHVSVCPPPAPCPLETFTYVGAVCRARVCSAQRRPGPGGPYPSE
jgi:hypothetical protein